MKKARANRLAFMVIEPNQTLRLQFDRTKSHIEEKIFNGQKTERVAQSQPIEEAMEDGYTVMEVTKVGEGMSLSDDVKPIE